VLDTRLSSVGHIIVGLGYDGTSVIANDPWGNANNPNTWGKKIDGNYVTYTWTKVAARWMIEVSNTSIPAVYNQPQFAPPNVYRQ
jgi:hypothetical protein